MKNKTPPQIFNVNFTIPQIDSLKDTEFSKLWYFSIKSYNDCLTKKKYTNNDLRVLLEILKKFKPKQQVLKDHIKTIFHKFFIDILDNIQEYPDYDIFTETIEVAQTWFMFKDDLFSQKCHQYIMRQIKNQPFFDLNNSPLYELKAKQGKYNDITIPYNYESLLVISASHNKIDQVKKPPAKLTFNQVGNNSLFKFSAHIAPPSKPYLSIQDETPDYNCALTEVLISRGLADGSGELVENNEGLPKVSCLNFKTLLQIIFEAGKKIDIQIRTVINTLEWNTDIRQSFSDIMEKRKKLEIFSYSHSLALIRACLIKHDHGLDGLLKETQRLTDIAYQVSYAVNQIYLDTKGNHKREFCPEDNTFCLDLAGDILKHIRNYNKSIILQSGPPIKAEEKTGFSTHAFYVVLKYLEGEQLQIILVDGGTGSKYFTPVKKNKQDLLSNEYYCHAFKPISLKDEKKRDAVKNYIFSTLILPHMYADKDTEVETDASNKPIGPSPRRHKLLWKNIFLREDLDGQFFIGSSSKKFYDLEKIDSKQTFKRQIIGNCTVHNFKQALRIATDMTTLDYSRLEDNLALGLDNLIDSYALGFQP